MSKLLTFDQAIKKASKSGKKIHLLLGNGFSQACRPRLFAYGKLLETADFKGLPKARKVFDALETTDFETVMKALKSAAKLVPLYGKSNGKYATKMESDADALRDVLVKAISSNHPIRPNAISDAEFAAARAFLTQFERIYTINYDLLLYWALMHDGDGLKLKSDDGFRQPEEGAQEWVTWDSNEHRQNIFYLHGALHVFEDGPEIHKFTWCNTGVKLTDQIREALNDERYPLFVSEGTAEEKMTKISHSGFLHRAYRSFKEIGGTLFVFGLSFGDSDSHILDAIARNKVSQVFVSVYGDPDSEENKTLIRRAKDLVLLRSTKKKTRKLKVEFFDAASAKAWG